MRTAAAATALGITLSIAALASCTSDPGEMPVPSPSVTPVFASEEEALAAAEALYGEYVAYANALGQSGWADPSGFEEYLVGEALEEEISDAEQLRSSGYRLVGDATFDSLSLQQLNDLGPRKVDLVIYVCNDVSATDVLDADGNSVVSASRPDRQALEVEIEDSGKGLKIARREPWDGASFC